MYPRFESPCPPKDTDVSGSPVVYFRFDLTSRLWFPRNSRSELQLDSGHQSSRRFTGRPTTSEGRGRQWVGVLTEEGLSVRQRETGSSLVATTSPEATREAYKSVVNTVYTVVVAVGTPGGSPTVGVVLGVSRLTRNRLLYRQGGHGLCLRPLGSSRPPSHRLEPHETLARGVGGTPEVGEQSASERTPPEGQRTPGRPGPEVGKSTGTSGPRGRPFIPRIPNQGEKTPGEDIGLDLRNYPVPGTVWGTPLPHTPTSGHGRQEDRHGPPWTQETTIGRGSRTRLGDGLR